MKKYFTIVFLLSSSLAIAQPKISRNENFPIGWKLIFRNMDPASVNTWQTGANQTWDFSTATLLPDSSTEQITDPVWTPAGKDFPNANLVEQYSDGSYVYVNKNDSENYLVGYTGNGVKINYPESILFAKRPMTYLDSFTRKYTDNISIQGLNFNIRGGGTINIIADGYGTLKLPGVSYNNVLRLKITELQKDTSQPGGAISTTSSVSFVWFDVAHYSALLKIDSSSANNTITRTAEYLLREEMSGIDQSDKQTIMPVSACIRDNQLKIRSRFVSGAKYNLVLYDMLGQIIFNGSFIASGSLVEIIDIPEKMKSIYILDMQGENTKATGIKVIAQ